MKRRLTPLEHEHAEMFAMLKADEMLAAGCESVRWSVLPETDDQGATVIEFDAVVPKPIEFVRLDFVARDGGIDFKEVLGE